VAAEILELERQGEQVVVFAVTRPDEPFRHRFLEELRAPVVYLPYRPSREAVRVGQALVHVLRDDPLGWCRAAASLWPPRAKALRKLLQATVLCHEMDRAGITHAHAHFATTAARLANLSWRMGGPTYSVTAHAKDVWQEKVRTDRLRDKLGRSAFVATVSRANQVHLSAILDRPGDATVHLVPNSVDVERLQPSPAAVEPGLVVTVARLVAKKGVDDLLQGCHVLALRGVDFRLDVIGDGPLMPQLRRAAEEQAAPVRFLGSMQHDEVVARLRTATVFCLPCRIAADGDRDGLPTAVLEAMALGVPVVTTAVNGLADAVIDDVTGLVVPQRDPEAIADALHRVLKDPALAARLATSARRHVEENFALAPSVELLRSLFPGVGP
jgi:glycosyltransferase involved in cell wall biosynthesis